MFGKHCFAAKYVASARGWLACKQFQWLAVQRIADNRRAIYSIVYKQFEFELFLIKIVLAVMRAKSLKFKPPDFNSDTSTQRFSTQGAYLRPIYIKYI